MQLPQGRKERIQIIAIACIAVIGVIYCLVDYVILPFRTRNKECVEESARLQKQLEDANVEIGKGKHAKDECEEMRAVLRGIDSAYVLKDEYNNFDIKAQEYIKSVFAAAGIGLDSVLPAGAIYAVPRVPVSKFQSFVVPMSCSITGSRSYELLLDLFARIETNNPYMSVSQVRITAQQNLKQEPTVQSVNFSISWPIWRDPSIATNFLPRAEESEGTNATSAAASNGKEKRT